MIPMKPIEGVPDSSQVKPGMAFFADTGPIGKTCGHCTHRGYSRLSAKARRNPRTGQMEHKARRHLGCAVYRKLMQGRHGPEVDPNWKACKYFEQKDRWE